ncbi:hypothetical protein ACJJTC_003362 [Scirpophaga incertulas]
MADNCLRGSCRRPHTDCSRKNPCAITPPPPLPLLGPPPRPAPPTKAAARMRVIRRLETIAENKKRLSVLRSVSVFLAVTKDFSGEKREDYYIHDSATGFSNYMVIIIITTEN